MLIRTMVEEARRVQTTLTDDMYTMTLAIEQRQFAMAAHKTAKAAYDAAEAEFLFDLTMTNERYLAAKNVEAREIVKDRALVVARDGGALATAWRILSECATALENAQMAYDQAEVRFKAVRIAAELQSAMLIALTADAKLIQE